MSRIRRWLFNLWLDYWYLPRHPHHGMVIPLAVLYRMVQIDVLAGLRMATPELSWLGRVPSDEITESGIENRSPLVWGRS